MSQVTKSSLSYRQQQVVRGRNSGNMVLFSGDYCGAYAQIIKAKLKLRERR